MLSSLSTLQGALEKEIKTQTASLEFWWKPLWQSWLNPPPLSLWLTFDISFVFYMYTVHDKYASIVLLHIGDYFEMLFWNADIIFYYFDLT